MTDKQIIINKMDKPKRYCEGIDCAWCNEKEPCIYKIANELEEKLLRKEQECEELKKNVEHWKMEHKEAKAKGEWTYDLVKKRLGQQLDQLKAENEILKEKLVISSNSDKKTLKIIQTLTDIKEVAEICSVADSSELLLKRIKHILLEISEVEDAR